MTFTYSVQAVLAVLVGSLLLFLTSCGGGIAGSSNGGGNPAPDDKLLLGYSIEYLPAAVVPNVPDSLAAVEAPTDTTNNSQTPAASLSSSIPQINDLYLRFGLVQLYTDRVWNLVQAYCADLPQGHLCDLSDSRISFVYTTEMALWESQWRDYLFGEKDVPGAIWESELATVLHADTREKIGTTITIDAGSYRALIDEEYDHEVRMSLPDLETTGTVYRLQWSEDGYLVQTTVIKDDIPLQETSFQSIFRNLESKPFQSQQFVLSVQNEDSLNELQFSQYPIRGEETVFIESNILTIAAEGKAEIYSQGQVGSLGGFLLSETSLKDTNSIATVALQRELFGSGEIVYSYAECILLDSASECIEEQDWSLVQGVDLTMSEYYLAQSDLNQLGTDSRPFDLTLLNVSPNADSYLLLNRANLIIEDTPPEVAPPTEAPDPIDNSNQSFLQGILNLPFTVLNSLLPPVDPAPEPDPEPEPVDNTPPFDIAEANVLCRVSPTLVGRELSFRSFCIGVSPDLLSDAVVVSEFYENGISRLQWEAEAEVVINE